MLEKVKYYVEKTKEVVQENWKPFAIGAGTTVVVIGVAGVTFYVTRGRKIVIVSKMPLLGEKIPSEGRKIIMKRVTLKKSPVYIVTNNFGAPVNRLSRIVKCVETGQTTTSIKQMASEMGVQQSQISRHLDYPEMYPSVKGYHFESVGYAIPAG